MAIKTNTQPVEFKVTELLYDGNTNIAHVTVEYFNGNVKTYSRKAYMKKNGYQGYVLIQGVNIYFTLDLFSNTCIITKVERDFDVKGKSIKNTANKSVMNAAQELIEAVEEAKSVDLNETIYHERYNDIKTCLMCNIPVYLAGPAGSGKNHTVEQICEELGWGFYFSNSIQQEYKLTGFVDAAGDYHDTEFFKACTSEEDCVFFLDEMDASIPDVLVLLNAAIANGYFEFPTGRVELNNVHFVAAGNTVGTGADDLYTGRMVIDAATLDRFAIIDFDYSENVELFLSKNNNELVEFIHAIRKDAEEQGIRATFSYRCITMVTELENAGMQLDVIMGLAVVKGLDQDTINTLHPYCPGNKYLKALHQLVK